MAGWTLDVDNGAYTFPVPTRWSLRDRVEAKEDGTNDYIETVLALEVEIVGEAPDPAADCTAKFKELRDLMLGLDAHRIQIKLDGTTEFDLQPAAGMLGPKCRDIVEIPVGADKATHVRVQLGIYFKNQGPDGDANGVYNLYREVQEVWDAGKLIEKTWIAKCRARTIDRAKAKVKTFKPKVKPLEERYFERIDSNEYEAHWTWKPTSEQPTASNPIIGWSETITFDTGGNPWVPDPVIDGPPFMHEGRQEMSTIRIRMEVETSTDPVDFGPVARAHLKEDKKKIFRDRSKEQPEPWTLDRLTGHWHAVFEEFYYLTETDVNRVGLDHSGHEKAFGDLLAPPSGTIGGTPSLR